jgi:Mrp family chromosome partitioning ATPase
MRSQAHLHDAAAEDMLPRQPATVASSQGSAGAVATSDAPFGAPLPPPLDLLAPGAPWVDPRVTAAFETGSETVARIRVLRSALSSRWHADAPEERRAVALIGLDATVEVATVAANLGVVSAQLGWRTLLVDGDLHMPAQDALFGVPNEQGLSTLLQHPAGGRAAVQPTAIDRLALLPAGPIPPNPSELLERQPLLEVLDGQIGRQRLVLLSLSVPAHSPRFGALDTILSGFDGAWVLASRNSSALRPLQRLTRLVEESGVPLLGTAILG